MDWSKFITRLRDAIRPRATAPGMTPDQIEKSIDASVNMLKIDVAIMLGMLMQKAIDGDANALATAADIIRADIIEPVSGFDAVSELNPRLLGVLYTPESIWQYSTPNIG